MRPIAVPRLDAAVTSAWISGFWIGLVAGGAMSVACVTLALWLRG